MTDVENTVKYWQELAESYRKEMIKWKRIRKPTHGNCCTCQGCGLDHDSCRCDLDELSDEVAMLREENAGLRAHLIDVVG